MSQEIRVNWAYQSTQSTKEDTTNHFHIFVGDLSNEVNDEVLQQAFSAFGTISEARVMWDMKTGRSRGYGFVAFRDRADADKALTSMDGEWLGSRAIRCNWANQKGQPSMSQQNAMAAMGMTPTTPYGGHHHFPTHGIQSYDMIVQQTPAWQTTVYVGNLTPYTTQNDLIPLFQNFGYTVETRFQADRGFAFVKMDTHENAAMAICQLSGYQVNGRPLKCSVSRISFSDLGDRDQLSYLQWGKDRPPTGQFDGYSPQGNPQTPQYPNTPSAFFPQYGGPGGPMSPQGGPNSAGGPNHQGPQSPAGPGGNRWQEGNQGFGSPSGQAYGGMQNNNPNAGGFGRGNGANQGWQGANNAGGFTGNSNGFSGYPQ